MMLTIDDIGAMGKLSRTYVRDNLVKRADFPRPCLSLSQKNRRWDKAAIENWFTQQKTQISR